MLMRLCYSVYCSTGCVLCCFVWFACAAACLVVLCCCSFVLVCVGLVCFVCSYNVKHWWRCFMSVCYSVYCPSVLTLFCFVWVVVLALDCLLCCVVWLSRVVWCCVSLVCYVLCWFVLFCCYMI